MKNISLHAPLNNTNRNWERALIKKYKASESQRENSLTTTVFGAAGIYTEEGIVPIETVISNAKYTKVTESFQCKVYMSIVSKGTNGAVNEAIGVVVLPELYNNLKLGIEISKNSSTEMACKIYGENSTFTYCNLEYNADNVAYGYRDVDMSAGFAEITPEMKPIQGSTQSSIFYDILNTLLSILMEESRSETILQ